MIRRVSLDCDYKIARDVEVCAYDVLTVTGHAPNGDHSTTRFFCPPDGGIDVGHCAMGVSYENGHKDTVDPEAFTIVNGKLYVNHTKYWTNEWRKNETENISRADKNWETVKDTPEPTK